MASPHLKGHSHFDAAMQAHAKMLEAESAAGVPLGSASHFDDIPQTVDNGLLAFQETAKTTKRRFTRTSEHFTRRIMDLQERFQLRDPVMVLMEIADGNSIEPAGVDSNGQATYRKQPMKVDAKTRALAAAELCSFLYPKRKAVELSGTEGQAISFHIQADTTPVPEMPDEATIERMAKERREAAALAEKTLQGN